MSGYLKSFYERKIRPNPTANKTNVIFYVILLKEWTRGRQEELWQCPNSKRIYEILKPWFIILPLWIFTVLARKLYSIIIYQFFLFSRALTEHIFLLNQSSQSFENYILLKFCLLNCHSKLTLSFSNAPESPALTVCVISVSSLGWELTGVRLENMDL